MLNKNQDKSGVLIAGLNGSVARTFITGVLSIVKGKSRPIGSLNQMAKISPPKNTAEHFHATKEYVPVVPLDNLVIGGWDIKNENCYISALKTNVLNEKSIHPFRSDLMKIKPMPGVFDYKFAKEGVNGTFIKTGESKYDLKEQLRADIKDFKESFNLSRVIVLWCGSTELFTSASHVHISLSSFEKGMRENSELISPSMLYAYAAIAEGCHYINGVPNLSTDIPALKTFAEMKKVSIADKDFMKADSLIKTFISLSFA